MDLAMEEEDLRSVEQFARATTPSYRVATLQFLKKTLEGSGDDYLRGQEKMALLEVEVLEAIALYASEDAIHPRSCGGIPRVERLTREAFRREYMFANVPVIVGEVVDASWCFSRFRGGEGGVDVGAMAEVLGDVEVPVRDEASKTTSTSRFREFAASFDEGRLYLKDWHFRLDGLSCMAPIPPLFDDDWLSGEPDMDYHFCYLGAKGTRTGLHCDVINSYSWSVNVCGLKKWRFLPADETCLLRDAFGSGAADAFGPSSLEFPRLGLAKPMEVVKDWEDDEL